MTASKCSGGVTAAPRALTGNPALLEDRVLRRGRRRPTGSIACRGRDRALPPHEVEQRREHVARHVLAHEDVLVAVPGKDLQLMLCAAELPEPTVALDVRVAKNVVVRAGRKQHRR